MPRPTEFTTRRPRTTFQSPTPGTSHPQTGSKRPPHRQNSTAHTSCPRQILRITLPCRRAATSLQVLQQSPTAHAHAPPTRPYVPNRTTPARDALIVCTDFRSLRTGRVPGQPGVARPPAPQDHNPEDDTPRPRAPTPQIRLARQTQDHPTELRATRTTRNSFPTPELAGTHLT